MSFEQMITRIFKNFNYFGIHIEAYTNQNGLIKKKCIQPKPTEYKNKNQYLGMINDYQNGKTIEPNAIQIDTKNLSVIDIDDPKQCPILDKLKIDCKFYVKTNKGYHFYFNLCNQLLKSESGAKGVLCGIADINIDKLWFCPIYFHNEDRLKKFYYVVEEYEKLVDMPDYAVMWCNMLISMKNCGSNVSLVPKVNKTKSREEIIEIIPDIQIEKFDIETMKLIYDIYFKHNQFNDYDTWRNTAYMSRHLNNSNECFKLFDMYSRKVKNYENEPEINNRKAFYGKGEYNINFDENGILIKCAKLDIKMYDETLKHLYKNKYEDEFININTKYLFTDEQKYIFDDWNEYYKCLMLKSAYGTGKTYAFKKIIETYNPKRILFITYRQSLAHSLIQDLEEKFGFETYLNKKVDVKHSKRLIIQLDSIHKLQSYESFNFDTQSDNIPAYSLIVLDEMEGLLNHLSYEKIEQSNIFNILRRLLYKSKKILCLDGDLGDRSLDFMNNIKIDYKLYRNVFKPNKKNFILTSNIEKFNDSVETDLSNGKKIVIVCMTKTESEKYNSMYKDNYKVIIHNSIEKNKEILLNVKENWADCDLLIYSPSVESGVDFDVSNYFYKCYALLSNQSTSYRAFNQMLNRVRFYENNDVMCYYNKEQMEFSTLLSPYRFNEVKLYKYTGMEETPLINVLIHNDVESINSRNYFMPSFIKSILDKGHTYQHLNDFVKSKKDNTATEEIKDNIINAENLNEETYNNLLDKQRNNEEITREENNSINKMYYKKVWLLDNLDLVNKSFLDIHYNKIDCLKNNKLMNIKKEERHEIKNNEILKKLKFNKIDMMLKIVDTLGFDIHNKDRNISHELYETQKDKVIEILNSREYKTLFNCKKAIVKKERFSLNGLLETYGLKINSELHRKQINKVQTKTYTYKLSNLDFIDDYYVRLSNKPKNDLELIDFLD
jgi:hypothetical protein